MGRFSRVLIAVRAAGDISVMARSQGAVKVMAGSKVKQLSQTAGHRIGSKCAKSDCP